MSVSPVDFDSLYRSARQNHIPDPTTYAMQQIQQVIVQQAQKIEKSSIHIAIRPIANGFVLTLEHKGVKHERSVTDFSEIGAQVMVALAAINLEG